jgi:hypothetical protein
MDTCICFSFEPYFLIEYCGNAVGMALFFIRRTIWGPDTGLPVRSPDANWGHTEATLYGFLNYEVAQLVHADLEKIKIPVIAHID